MSGVVAALMEQTLGFQRVGIIITFSSEASISAPLQKHKWFQKAQKGRQTGASSQERTESDL